MHALLLAIILAQTAPANFSPPVPTKRNEWDLAFDQTMHPRWHRFTQADIFVGTDGKPLNCTVTVFSRLADYDRRTCLAIMRRGKFKPAMDEAGKPMNGIYRFAVAWLMEEGATRPNYPADATLTVRKLPKRNPTPPVTLNYLVDETGRITRCAVAKSSCSPKFDALACRAMPTRYTFAPARDAAGKAWPVVRSQTVGFELAK